MSLNNLTAELTESGEIAICDDKTSEIVYLIPAPMMWDANFETSHNVSMNLLNINKGKYTLTVTADSAWINAEERAFPVTIDPPLYDNSISSSIMDLSFDKNSAGNTVYDQKLYI